MEKELDEEAPQHEDDVRRSAPFSPAALLSMGGQPSTPRVRRARLKRLPFCSHASLLTCLRPSPTDLLRAGPEAAR